jgi:selenium-dependent xanthine dehydrogenase
MPKVCFVVNGKEVRVEAEADEMLADVLRQRLGLTGTKIGCNEDECGACTVLLDGEPVLSCTVPVMRVEGGNVLTIEGLARNGDLHPLQEAFIAQGAVQCGFCIPGQILNAYALLQRNPDPPEQEIRKAMKGTLCRCGGYSRIVDAIREAARSMRTGEPVRSPTFSAEGETGIVHTVVPRPDAGEKVTGGAKFADDYQFEGMLHGRVLRAGIPHGVLTRLDVSKAQQLDGVIAVLTAGDIPGEKNHGVIVRDWPVLVGIGEKVRYVGDAVALVAAISRKIATRALALIDTRYEALPVVGSAAAARAPGSAAVHEGGNLLKHIKVRKGDLKKGISEADVVVDEVFHTQTTEHAFLEPECSIARPVADGGLEVYVGSQIPYEDRSQIAACLGLAQEQVRVIGTMIGGAFGGKEDIAGQIHAALLAKATGRPVKVLFDRHESLLVHPKRHATRIHVRLGAKKDGRLRFVETELLGDTGAYASLGEKVMTRATTHSAGPYVIPHVKADCYAMYTNNPPAGAFRGFGVTQSCYAIESCMDMLAHRLGIDPIELRRKNALRVGSRTSTGQLLRESVGLEECIQRTQDKMMELCGGHDPFHAQQIPGRPELVRVWGFAASFKNTGLGEGAPDKAGAEIEVLEDGIVEVRSAAAEVGQGLVAVLQMIAAEALRIPLRKVRVLLSDTKRTPDAGPTTASRQTFVTGNAVRRAAEALWEAIRSSLAERFDVHPTMVQSAEEGIRVDSRMVSWDQIGALMRAEGRMPRASYEYWAPETKPLGSGGDMHFTYSYATQAAEVEVDVQTGEVRVLRVIAAADVGRAINPLGVLGQVEGGVVMGVGGTLTEEFIVEDGVVVTDRLVRYRVPSAMVAPQVIPIVVEHPVSDGPFGAKGAGEIASVPTAPAITNAIFNACGVRVRRLPVDQDWLARQIAQRRVEAEGAA